MATDTIPTEEQLRDWITNGAENRNRYPLEAIEPTLGLLGYLFRRCNGNINLLVEHSRHKGFNRDYNYFYQVLTGRYFRVEGKEKDKEKVQGSWRNLRDIWMQLQVFDRFAAQLAKLAFVETSVFNRINEYIQIKRTPFNACRFGAIVGHTGVGKSESFKEIMRREKPDTIYRMESPAVASLSHFVHKFAAVTGGKPSWSIGRKRAHNQEVMTPSGRTLILDNAQRCFLKRSGESQPIFDYLQELQEDTNCTIILSWTPVHEAFVTEFTSAAYFEQFVGRIGGEREILRIEDYPIDEDVELIAASFKLAAKDIRDLMPKLRELVREKGRIRNLFNTLQKASRLANKAEVNFCANHVISTLEA